MRNIRITLAYEGTAYSGFQRQENSITVQEILETALQKLTGTKTTLYFVARTDAGVHAYGQECTFYTESSIPGDRFIFALNILLPPDIRVTESREVPYDFPCAGTITEKPTATSLPKKKTAPLSLNGIPGRRDENWIFQKWKKRQKCCQALMTSPHSAGIIPFLPVRSVLSMTYGSSKSITSFTFSSPEKDSFIIW